MNQIERETKTKGIFKLENSYLFYLELENQVKTILKKSVNYFTLFDI